LHQPCKPRSFLKIASISLINCSIGLLLLNTVTVSYLPLGPYFIKIITSLLFKILIKTILSRTSSGTVREGGILGGIKSQVLHGNSQDIHIQPVAFLLEENFEIRNGDSYTKTRFFYPFWLYWKDSIQNNFNHSYTMDIPRTVGSWLSPNFRPGAVLTFFI
jgi:hypothetical protein